MVGTAAGQTALSGWPMIGHDAGLSSRSTARSAQRPVLRLGWPRPGFPYAFDLSKQLLTTNLRPLVAPNGTIVLAGGPTTAIANPNGTIQKVLPIGPITAIDPAGNLLGFVNGGYGVASYTPQGRRLWVAPISGHSAADRALLVAATRRYLCPDLGLVGHRHRLRPGTCSRPSTPSTMLNCPAAIQRAWRLRLPARCMWEWPPIQPRTHPLLYALHPDGSPAWPSPTTLPGGVAKIALAPDGTLRVLDDKGHLSAVGTDGRVLWSVPVFVGGGLAIAADGTTVVNFRADRGPGWATFGRVEGVASDGTIRWAYGGKFGQPIIGGDGTIYLGGTDQFVALRPDGTRLFNRAIGIPLIPEAIGIDGTLYAAETGRGAPIVALAGPSAPTGSPIPDHTRLRQLISPLSMTVRFRTHGAAVTCPTPGHPCSPTTPLGSMVSFTLLDPATVLFTVRRASDGHAVAHTAQRLLAGTVREEPIGGIYPDSASIFPQWLTKPGGLLRPGRYTITARATFGRAVDQTRPVGFVVLN